MDNAHPLFIRKLDRENISVTVFLATPENPREKEQSILWSRGSVGWKTPLSLLSSLAVHTRVCTYPHENSLRMQRTAGFIEQKVRGEKLA